MTYVDWIKIVGPILGFMATGFIWIGRKLEFVDGLKKADLPERVLKLEILAGIR